jgi:SAM-dependent methyltransferase
VTARPDERRPEALDRAAELLAPEAAPKRSGAETELGYLDLLGSRTPPSPGPMQDLMLSRLLPRVYERWWRPALGRVVKGAFGPSMRDEVRIARSMLGLEQGERALDVACGTGAFTRELARAVGPSGLVVGIDVSQTMLERAVAGTPPTLAQVAYIRGDAEALPFRDGSFDAICCFAALNLFGRPMRALDRFAAVLAPGGRLALFTSARSRSASFRTLQSAVTWRTGIHLFDPDELAAALRARGFADVRQRLTGFTQFVEARRGGDAS